MIKIKILPGSTLAVISLQGIGTDVRGEKKIFYKKSFESEYTEWTVDRGLLNGEHPYHTTWYWIGQHYQIVIDELDPDTTYNLFVTINGNSSSALTFSTDVLPELWPPVPYGSSQPSTYEIWETFINTYFTPLLQKVGFSAVGKFYFTTDGSTSASGGANASFFYRLLAFGIPKENPLYAMRTIYHELRHYLGADGTHIPKSLTGLLQMTSPCISDKNFNVTCDAYSNSGKVYYHHAASGKYSDLDKVYQFMTGSDNSHYNDITGHDCIQDSIYQSNQYESSGGGSHSDILHWFILKGLAFNKINLVVLQEEIQTS